MMTPTLAEQLLETCTYDRQRPVREHHVNRYAAEMKAGRFRTSVIRLVQWEGREYLTDGQHRLWAVVQSGATVPMVILRIVAESEAEIAEDYTVTDSGMGRNAVDMHRAYNLTAETGLQAKQLRYLSAATRLIVTGFSPYDSRSLRSFIPNVAARRAMLDWASEAREYYALMNGGDPPVIMTFTRAAVMAVALVTLRYQAEAAREFWSTVAHNDGLHKGTTARTLVDRLLSTPADSLPPYTYTRIPAHAWNAHREKREISKILIKTGSEKEPIHILGTPFEGRVVLRMDYANHEKPKPTPAAL